MAVLLVRNEEDLIADALHHLATEVDHIVVADNLSTDKTYDILRDLRAQLPLTVYTDDEPAFYQGAKLSRLADVAGNMGAEWIVPLDADELVYASSRPVRDTLTQLPTTIRVVDVQLYNHYPTTIDNPSEPVVFRRIGWRKPWPVHLGKIAFRFEKGATIADGSHSVRLPSGDHQSTPSTLGIRHYSCRTVEQFVAKSVHGGQALNLTNLDAGTGVFWRQNAETYARYGYDALARSVRETYVVSAPQEAGMVHDPAPFLRWPTP
jgi:glycosyltransferase involved in cell wall biosynthesis